MDCTEAIDRLEGKSSPKPTLQELAAIWTKGRVTRVVQMQVEGRTTTGINCPPPPTDGLADYLDSPQPLHREFCLQYYRKFAKGDLPPSTCDRCCRHGRLAHPTEGIPLMRVGVSQTKVGLITVAEYRLREK